MNDFVKAHPEHTNFKVGIYGGLSFDTFTGKCLNPVAKPVRASWWQQIKRERSCRRGGGHYWHPDKGMIDWFCCQCGAETEGMPKDGQ